MPKRYGSKRGYKKQSFSKNQVKAIKAISYKTSLAQEEKKFYDISTTTSSTNAGAIVALSGMALGGTDVTREGDKARMLHLKWRVNWNINALQIVSICRMIVFQWHLDDTITPPTLALVLQSATNINSMYNHDNGPKFSVLYDKTVALNYYGNTSITTKHSLNLKKNKYFKRNLKYIAGATTGQDMIYMLHYTTTTSNHPAIDFYFRLNYTDS